MNGTSIRVKQATVSTLANGFIRILIDEEAEITSNDILEINAAKSKLAGNQPHIVLFIAPKNGSITSEARATSASKEVNRNAIAKAIVTKSLPQRLIGNLFIKFNKPPAPTKLFSIEKDAIEWLKMMKTGSESKIYQESQI
ncbi:MAG TPA: hypothetical protein VK177_19800 [Flavobacteriales bacterium]|nr:hypothetical protein [Flavobacteriales bacterium]